MPGTLVSSNRPHPPTWQTGSGTKPPQLFPTPTSRRSGRLPCPTSSRPPAGSGRCTDLFNSVNGNAPVSLSVSIAGANTFEVGNIVSQYAVSTGGAIALQNVTGARLAALTNILGLPYPNLQANAYAGVAAHSINAGALLQQRPSPRFHPDQFVFERRVSDRPSSYANNGGTHV